MWFLNFKIIMHCMYSKPANEDDLVWFGYLRQRPTNTRAEVVSSDLINDACQKRE